MRLNAKVLRHSKEQVLKELAEKLPRRQLYFILEDIFDTYNVGGLFRLADALAAQKIFLCGQTETPPNPKIKKASVGTYNVVPWEYKKTAAKAIKELRKHVPKIKIIAIEQHKKSLPYTKVHYELPLAFVVGNETRGIKPATLKLADLIVEIPMAGLNRSLNVIVAAAVVAFFATRGVSIQQSSNLF